MIQARTFLVELSMDIGQHNWTSSLFTMMYRYCKSTPILLTEFIIDIRHVSMLYHIAPPSSTQHHPAPYVHITTPATPHRITAYHTASHHASLAPLHDTRITSKITIVCSRQCMFNVYVCNAHSIVMFTRLWQHFI